jgi:DNA-binding winged helix-turn-helix (wHTH) protein
MLAAAPVSRVLRFDSYELDIRAGELRKAGVKLRLQGQPIQVLAALLNSAGELVTREQLRAEVWPVDTFVDFDHSLHNTIARIREVLGDSAETPRYIETLPRRGYRYIGSRFSDVAASHRNRSPCESAANPGYSSEAEENSRPGFRCSFCARTFCLDKLALSPPEPGRSANTVPCRPSARQFVRRPLRGIFRRRHDGPVDYRPR